MPFKRHLFTPTMSFELFHLCIIKTIYTSIHILQYFLIAFFSPKCIFIFVLKILKVINLFIKKIMISIFSHNKKKKNTVEKIQVKIQ